MRTGLQVTVTPRYANVSTLADDARVRVTGGSGADNPPRMPRRGWPLLIAWVLIVWFSEVSLSFVDLTGIVTAVEGGVFGVRLIGPLLQQLGSTASVRYVAYALAFVIGMGSLRWMDGTRLGPVFWAWQYALWALVSSAWSVSPVLTGIKALVLVAGVSVVCSLTRWPDGSATLVRAAVWTLGGIVASALCLAVLVPGFALEAYWGWYPRLGGEFVGPNALGTCAGVLFLLVSWWPLEWRWRSRVPVQGVALIALVLTQSRTGMGATVAAWLVVHLVAMKPGIRALMIASGAALILVFLLVGPDLGGYLGVISRGSVSELYLMLAYRMDVWQYGLDRGAHSPFLGYGFAAGSRIVLGQDIAWRPIHAHSLAIEVFVTLGVIGVAIVAVLMGSLLRRLGRLVRLGGDMQRRGLAGLGVVVFLLAAGVTDRSFAGEMSVGVVALLIAVAIAADSCPKNTKTIVVAPEAEVATGVLPQAATRALG